MALTKEERAKKAKEYYEKNKDKIRMKKKAEQSVKKTEQAKKFYKKDTDECKNKIRSQAKEIKVLTKENDKLKDKLEKIKFKQSDRYLKKSLGADKSPWVAHVKNYAKKNKITYFEALKLAKDSYKPKLKDLKEKIEEKLEEELSK